MLLIFVNVIIQQLFINQKKIFLLLVKIA